MTLRIAFLIAALGMTGLAPAADARPRDREQDAAYKATKQGRFMPLREIEAQIVPRVGDDAEYLGPELDVRAGIYRLKFMGKGRVFWIDVDARTGHIRGRSGR